MCKGKTRYCPFCETHLVGLTEEEVHQHIEDEHPTPDVDVDEDTPLHEAIDAYFNEYQP